MYLDEVKEDDKRISDAWKEDSNGILVFVSPNSLIPPFISDELSDWSFLSNCWRLHHRILQTAVSQFRRSDSNSSCKRHLYHHSEPIIPS